MFEDAYYNWREEPDDGEYELQFDRFESLDSYHDHVYLLVVDDPEGWPIGDITIPVEETPEIEPEDRVGTAIFRGMIEDKELVTLEYNSKLTEQGIEEARKSSERVRATSDDENTDIEESEDR